MPSRASGRPPTIRGGAAPQRWNGRCRRRRRSTSSKCCRGYSNQECAARRRARLASFKSKEARPNLSVVDHSAIDLGPRISEAEVGDYLALLKPRVMSLVVFTALVGLMIAPVHVHPVLAFTAILCIAVGAGASGALNMAYEGDIDALMTRTANRPIPRGRITQGEATAFGLTLAFFSVVTLGTLVNWVAGGLLAFTIFFYVVIYTIGLKRWTAQNIVIGGAAGALPPVVAWAAATGTVDVEPLLLFAIIFFWTPPHFWALALFRSDDYARAGIPMLPNVAGPDATRLQILLYTIVLIVVAAAPWALGYFDAIYGIVSLILGAGMLGFAINVYIRRERSQSLRATRKLFAFSILYLFALFATLLAEVVFRALAPMVGGA